VEWISSNEELTQLHLIAPALDQVTDDLVKALSKLTKVEDFSLHITKGIESVLKLLETGLPKLESFNLNYPYKKEEFIALSQKLKTHHKIIKHFTFNIDHKSDESGVWEEVCSLVENLSLEAFSIGGDEECVTQTQLEALFESLRKSSTVKRIFIQYSNHHGNLKTEEADKEFKTKLGDKNVHINWCYYIN